MTTGNDWLEQARRLVADVGQALAAGPEAPDDATAAHGAECRWCPVCQVIGVLRGERPELTAALADALTSAAAALRATAAAPRASGEESSPGEEPDRAVVQHIEIA